MQRTSATCYFAYNDAAVHANARNHPGNDIKRDRRRHPPEAIRVKGALLRPLTVPDTTKEKKEKKEEKMDRLFSSRDRNGVGNKKSEKWSRLRVTGPSHGK